MKQSEIKILTDDELVDKLNSLIKSQEETKLTHVVSPIENPVQIKFLRRDIARLKTAIVNRDMKINFKDNEPEQ